MIEWLATIPPLVIYLLVGLVIGVESVGVPLPGEIVLVSSGVVASQGIVNPLVLGLIAAAGAIVGDSIGYAIGNRYGRGLLAWMGRKAPKHFGPDKIAEAERAFDRWGAWAVFGGRFIALLRILAGPLAGVLGMRYSKFLAANATGGILWASTVTTAAYVFGLVAERWIHNFSWFALVLTVLLSVVIMWVVKRKAARRESGESSSDQEDSSSLDVETSQR